jgi:hypothetical protein
MHGDIDDPSTIVLKEDDYLNYAQNHIMIELFIKNLLVNHTFVFVGYSINDNNLKLIMSWINYYAEQCGATERAKHFFIDVSEEDDENMRRYLEKKRVFVLSHKDIPPHKSLEEDKKFNSLDNEFGRRLYCVLHSIKNYDPSTHLPALLEKCQVFRRQNSIYYRDLLAVLGIRGYTFTQGELGFISNGDERDESFAIIKAIFESTEEAEYIRSLFSKAHISRVVETYGQWEKELIEVPDQTNTNEQSRLNEYASVYDYISLADALKTGLDNMEQVYYFYRVFGFRVVDSVSAYTALAKFERKHCETFFERMRLEFNLKATSWLRKNIRSSELEDVWFLMPEQQKKGVDFFYRITTEPLNTRELAKEFDDHKKHYLTEINIQGDALSPFKKLQTLSYIYYYFINSNYIMIDHYTNPKDYLSLYVEAILLSYSPQVIRNRVSSSFFEFGKDLNAYAPITLSDIDLDIFLRFCDLKKLKDHMEQYGTENLMFGDCINIGSKFHNLSCSYNQLGGHVIAEQLFRFIFLLAYSELDTVVWDSIINDICMLVDKFEQRDPEHYRDFYTSLRLIAWKSLSGEARVKLIRLIITSKYYLKRHPYGVLDIIRSMQEDEYPLFSDVIEAAINKPETKWSAIYATYPAMSNDKKTWARREVTNNIQSIGISLLCEMIWVSKVIEYSDEIQEKILSELQKAKAKKILGVHFCPDDIEEIISSAMLLKLTGTDIDLTAFSGVADDYINLAFLLDPEHFDYTRLETLDYMWINFFRRDDLRDSILRNGKEIVGNLLRKDADAKSSNDEIRSIYYKYFYK